MSHNNSPNDDEQSAMAFLVNDLVREILSTLKEQQLSSSSSLQLLRTNANTTTAVTGDISDSDINAQRRHVLDKTSLFFLSRTCFDFVSTAEAHPSCALILSTLMDFSLRGLVGAKEGGSLQQGDLMVLQESSRKGSSIHNTSSTSGSQHGYDPAPTKQLRRRAIEVAGDVLASIGPGNAQRCFPGVSSFVAKQLTGVAANNSASSSGGPPPMLLRSLPAIRSLLKRAEQHVLMTGPRSCLSRTDAHLRELSRAVEEGVAMGSTSSSTATNGMHDDDIPPSPFPPSWHFIFHPNTTNAPLDLYTDLRTLMALAVGLFGRGLAACLHPSDPHRTRWLSAVFPHLQQHMSLVLSEEVIFLSQHITLDDDRSSELMSTIVRGSRKLKSLIHTISSTDNDSNNISSKIDVEASLRSRIAALGAEMDAAQTALISAYADRTDILTAAVNIAATTFEQQQHPSTSSTSSSSTSPPRLGVFGEYGVSISGLVSELLTLLIDCGMPVVVDTNNTSSPTGNSNNSITTTLSTIGKQIAKGMSLVVYEDLNRHMASRQHQPNNGTIAPPFVLRWLTSKISDASVDGDDADTNVDASNTVSHILDFMEQSWLPDLIGALRGLEGIPSPTSTTSTSPTATASPFLSLHTSIHWEPSPGRMMPSWLPIVGTYLLPTTLLVLLRQWVPLEKARQEKYIRYQAHLERKKKGGQQQHQQQDTHKYTSLPLTSVPLPFHLALQRQEREELIQAIHGHSGGGSIAVVVDEAASKIVIEDLVDDVCEGVVENLSRYLTLLTPSQVGSGEGWTERGGSNGTGGINKMWGTSDDSSGQAEVDDMLRVVRTATSNNHSSSSSSPPLLHTPILGSEYAPYGTIHTLGTVRLLDGYLLLFNTLSTPTTTTSSSSIKKKVVPNSSATESLLERCMVPLVEECLYQQPDAYTSHIGAMRLHFHAHFLGGRMCQQQGVSPSVVPSYGAGCFTRPGPGGYSLSTLSYYFTNYGVSVLPTPSNSVSTSSSHPQSLPTSLLFPKCLLSLLSLSAASWLISRPMSVSLVGDNTSSTSTATSSAVAPLPLFEKLLVPLLSREEFTRVDTTFQRDYIRAVERDLQEATLAAQQEEDGDDDSDATPANTNTTTTSSPSTLVALLRSKRLFRCTLLGREVIGTGNSGVEEEVGGCIGGEGILTCVTHSLLAEGVAVTSAAHFTAMIMAQHNNNITTPSSQHDDVSHIRLLIGDVLPEVQKAGKRLLVLTMFPVMQMAAPLPFEGGGTTTNDLLTAGSEFYRSYVQASAQGLISNLLRPLSVFANQKVPVEIAINGLMSSLHTTPHHPTTTATSTYLLTASPYTTSSGLEDDFNTHHSSALSTTTASQGYGSSSSVLSTTIHSNNAFLQVILANTSYGATTGGDASSFVLNQRELIIDECFRMLRTKRADRRAAVYTILGTAVDQLISARQQRYVQLQQHQTAIHKNNNIDRNDDDEKVTQNEDISLHYVPVAVGSHTGILSTSLAFTKLLSSVGCDGDAEDGVDCAADVAANNLTPYLSNTSWETTALLTKVIHAVEEGLSDVSALFGSSAPGGDDPQGMWVEPCLRTCSRTLTLAAFTVREVYWWRRQIKCELRRIVGTAPATPASPLGTCSCMGIASSPSMCRNTENGEDDDDEDAFVTEDDSDGEDDYFVGSATATTEEVDPTTTTKSKKRAATLPTPTEEEMEVELDHDGNCSDRPPMSIPSTTPSGGDPNDDTSKTTLRELPIKAWLVQRALYTLTIISRLRDDAHDDNVDNHPSVASSTKTTSPATTTKALLDLITAYNRVVRECISLQLQVLQLSRRLATLLAFLKGRRGGYLQSESNITSFVNFLQSSFDSIVTIFTQPKIIKKMKSVDNEENEEDGNVSTNKSAEDTLMLLKSSKHLVGVKQLHVEGNRGGGHNTTTTATTTSTLANIPSSSPITKQHQYHIHWHLRVAHWSLLHSLYNAVLMPLVVAVETSSSSSSNSSNNVPQRGSTGLSLELMLQEGRRLSSSVVKTRIADVNALLRGSRATTTSSTTTSTTTATHADQAQPEHTAPTTTTATSPQSAVIVATPRWPVWLSKFPVDSHHKLILQLLERMLRMSPGFLLQRFVEEVAPLLVYIWYRRLLVVGAGRGGGHESVNFGAHHGAEDVSPPSTSNTTPMTPQEKRKMGALVLSRSGRGTTTSTTSSNRGEYFLPTQRESLLGKALLKLLRTIHEEAHEAHIKEQRRKRFNEAHMARQYAEVMQEAKRSKSSKKINNNNDDDIDNQQKQHPTRTPTTAVEEVNTSDDDDEGRDDNDDLDKVLKSQGVKVDDGDVDPLINNPDFDVLPSAHDDGTSPPQPSTLGADDEAVDSQSRYMRMLDHYYQQVNMGVEHIAYVHGVVAGASTSSSS